MTRYVIIGAGAVGCAVAAGLHLSGRRVALVARGANLAALRERGLRYLRPDGEQWVRLPVVDGPDGVELTSDDVLVVATKSQDTEDVLRAWAWRPVTAPNGTETTAATQLPVVLAQNGLENERAALRRFATVFGAVVWLPATHLNPGEVVAEGSPSLGALWLGHFPEGGHPRLAGIAEDFTAAGLPTRVVEDIRRWKAAKLVANTINALDALYRPSPLRAAAGRVLAREARAALTAAGLEPEHLDPGLVRETAAVRPPPAPPRGGSSTWQSLTRGSSVETDYLNGEIALLARLLGRTAPANAALVQRMHRAVAEGVTPASLDDADLAATLPEVARRDVLLDVEELRDLLAQRRPPTVLDVRWKLGDPDGRRHYADGHIPGAVYVDLYHELAAPATPERGRHPLPEPAALQAAARGWGVSAGWPVVVYDDTGGTAAARAWWLLRWAGVADVRLLDGGLGAWRAVGLAVAVGEEHPEHGDVTLESGRQPVLSADQAAALAADPAGVLLDARAGERYRGEVEPIDSRAGHIPGARSAPTLDNLGDDGAFRPTAELRERARSLGARPGATVGVYCGSGVTAAHQIAALAAVGVDAALYPGSWSAWSSDPGRPVETGPDPAETEAAETGAVENYAAENDAAETGETDAAETDRAGSDPAGPSGR
jgi:thiosulfate/3-mercaptopyruvate sulfurtransferase